MNGQICALNSHVLVLNKLWMAIRVIDARRAFSLLVRDLAEVIRVDDGSYTGHDFESWTEISEFAHQFDAPDYEFVRKRSSSTGAISLPETTTVASIAASTIPAASCRSITSFRVARVATIRGRTWSVVAPLATARRVAGPPTRRG